MAGRRRWPWQAAFQVTPEECEGIVTERRRDRGAGEAASAKALRRLAGLRTRRKEGRSDRSWEGEGQECGQAL